MTKVLNKITTATIGVDVEKEIAKNAKGKDVSVAKKNEHNSLLFRVGGIASGIESGSSQFGDWIAFEGQFQAVLIETGEVFRSPRLFLPGMAESLLKGAVTTATGPVSFLFDIGVTPDPEGAVGYQWEVTSQMEPDEGNDPVSQLFAAKDVPALPAPTKTPDATKEPTKPGRKAAAK